jgi:hypothetical protein
LARTAPRLRFAELFPLFDEASVAGLDELHLTPSIAAAISALGWSAEDPLLREAAPTAARGHNLVLVLPPSPAAATPAVSGFASRLGEGRAGLLLSPAVQLGEWGRMLHQVAPALRVQVAHGTARATRRLRDHAIDLLVATPETAVVLQRRSALRAETLAGVILAWPELWEDEDALSPLMQDLEREAQRIVLTSRPERTEGLVERYARRALALGAHSLDGEPVGTPRRQGMVAKNPSSPAPARPAKSTVSRRSVQ